MNSHIDLTSFESDLSFMTPEQLSALTLLMGQVDEAIHILGKRDVPGRTVPKYYRRLAGIRSKSARSKPYSSKTQVGGVGDCNSIPWAYKYAVYSAILIGGALIATYAVPYAYSSALWALNNFMWVMGFDKTIVQVIAYIANLSQIIGPRVSEFFCTGGGLASELAAETAKFAMELGQTPETYKLIAAYKYRNKVCTGIKSAYKKYWKDVKTVRERAQDINNDLTSIMSTVANSPANTAGVIRANLNYLETKKNETVTKITNFAGDLKPIWGPIQNLGEAQKGKVDRIANYMCSYIHTRLNPKPSTPTPVSTPDEIEEELLNMIVGDDANVHNTTDDVERIQHGVPVLPGEMVPGQPPSLASVTPLLTEPTLAMPTLDTPTFNEQMGMLIPSRPEETVQPSATLRRRMSSRRDPTKLDGGRQNRHTKKRRHSNKKTKKTNKYKKH
jgi:hypothetical protein